MIETMIDHESPSVGENPNTNPLISSISRPERVNQDISMDFIWAISKLQLVINFFGGTILH